MSCWQVSSDLDLIFMVQWSKLSFWVMVFFSNTICNRSTIFGVWKYVMIYMSVAQVNFDLDLILTVHFSVFSFSVLVCFSLTISIRSTFYLLYGSIVSCTCLPGMDHLTLTSFSWFIGQCLFLLVNFIVYVTVVVKLYT